MPSVLIVHESSHGHTKRIAETLATDLRARGVDAFVTTPKEAGALDFRRFDAVVIGAPIHFGHVPGSIVDFVHDNRVLLLSMPSAAFTVSLSAACDDEVSLAEVARHFARFVDDTGFRPPLHVELAGAISYTHYGPLTRALTKMMCRARGLPTDTSRDYVLTDWADVDDLAEAIARELASFRKAA